MHKNTLHAGRVTLAAAVLVAGVSGQAYAWKDNSPGLSGQHYTGGQQPSVSVTYRNGPFSPGEVFAMPSYPANMPVGYRQTLNQSETYNALMGIMSFIQNGGGIAWTSGGAPGSMDARFNSDGSRAVPGSNGQRVGGSPF